MDMAGEPFALFTVEDGVGYLSADCFDKPVAQFLDALRVLSLGRDAGPDGSREPDDRRDVQGARADAAFLAATVQQRHARHVTTEQEGSHPERATELVARERERSCAA